MPINDQKCCCCAYRNGESKCTLYYPHRYVGWLDWCTKWKDYKDTTIELESEAMSKISETDIEDLRSEK